MKIIYKTAQIEAITKGDDLYFIHPLTNQQCEHIEQCLTGWSEQDTLEQSNLELLLALTEFYLSDIENYIYDDVDYTFSDSDVHSMFETKGDDENE